MDTKLFVRKQSGGMFAIIDKGLTTGSIFWVCSSTGTDAAGYGKNPDAPFASIDYAVGQCTASKGDRIYVMPGHTESVIAAGGLDLDVIGITIEFLGEGNGRGCISFGTATTADMDIDAADVTLINPRFVAAIDALAGPIDVNAARFKMFGATWQDGTSINTTDCLVADANADDMVIDGFEFIDGDAAGTQKQSFIQIAGATRPTIKRVKCTGDFATGIIENGTAWVDAYLEDLVLDNASASPTVAIYLKATSSGQARNCHLRVASGTTYVTADNDMQWFECYGTGTDATAGEKIGTQLAGDIEAKVDVIDGYHDVPTADAATNTVLRDVVGNKTDAAVNAATTTKTLMAYLKGVLNEIAVPSANNTDNSFVNDVLGNKSDTAATGAVTATDTIVAYIKQLVTELAVVDEFHDVPAANNVLNAQINEVIGNKEDTAATGAVTTTDTIVAYIKQLVTDCEAILADTDTIAGIALPINPTAQSLAAYIASGGTALGTELADSKSIVDALGHTGSAFVAGGLGSAIPHCVVKTGGTIPDNTTDDLFTISGGPVRAKIVGIVTTIIGGAANGKLQITTTSPAATVELNAAAVAIDADAVGTIYQNVGATSVFTPSAGLGYALVDPVTVEETEFILTPGTVKFHASAAQTGAITWYMTFTPLSPDAVVTAAA